MLAGWQMAQCSTPLSSPDYLVEALIWLLEYAAMEPGTNIDTTMMSSVLPPLLQVRLHFAFHLFNDGKYFSVEFCIESCYSLLSVAIAQLFITTSKCLP